MDAASLYNSVNILSKRKKVLREFILKCQQKTGPLNGRLLDVGCGDGAVTELVRTLVDSDHVGIEGCDTSQDMIDFAKHTFESTGIDFFVMDIEKDLPDRLRQRYDYVISSFVFHWVQDQKKSLSNVYSLLRPGGECLLTFLPKAPHFTAYREMALNPRWAPFMHDVEQKVSPYQDCNAPDQVFHSLMEQCGFREVEVTCFARVHNQGSISSLRDLLRSINPFLKRIPEKEKEDYVSELMKVYMRCTAQFYPTSEGLMSESEKEPEKSRQDRGENERQDGEENEREDGKENGRKNKTPIYYPYHFLKAMGTK